MPGPRPIPAELRLVNGNASKRPIPDVPKPKVKIPKCPTGMKNKDARAEWRRVTPELERLGLISSLDVYALAGYCTAVAMYLQAMRELDDPAKSIQIGRTGATTSAWKRQLDESLKQIRQFCAEFGLSPAARVRLATAPKSKTDQANEDEAFRNKRTAEG